MIYPLDDFNTDILFKDNLFGLVDKINVADCFGDNSLMEKYLGMVEQAQYELILKTFDKIETWNETVFESTYVPETETDFFGLPYNPLPIFIADQTNSTINMYPRSGSWTSLVNVLDLDDTYLEVATPLEGDLFEVVLTEEVANPVIPGRNMVINYTAAANSNRVQRLEFYVKDLSGNIYLMSAIMVDKM